MLYNTLLGHGVFALGALVYLSNNHFMIPIIITGKFTLKEVRRVTWDVRSKWKRLGGELEVDPGTLDVSMQINSS